MWIELHDSSRDHPKMIKVAADLGVPKVHVLGHMCSLWSWCLRMAPDGDLSSFDVEDIEIGAEWTGEPGKFVERITARKLLDETESGYVVHDWDEYAAHLKAAERKRKERERKRKKREPSAEIRECPRKSADKVGTPRVSAEIRGRPDFSGPVTQTDRPTDRPDRPTYARSADRAPAPAAKKTPEPTPVIKIPLAGKGEHPVSKADIDEWAVAYPAVDVPQTLRHIRQWAIGSPAKRKTRKGIRRHITQWLAREQDRGGNGARASPPAITIGYHPGDKHVADYSGPPPAIG